HGAGKARRKPEWQSILRQLLAAGYLSLDLEGYGGLALSPRGQTVLRGEEDFFYRPDATPQLGDPGGGTARTATRATPRTDEPDLSSRDQDLLGELKALRSRLSKARNVPAYVVFSDRSLADMALNRPTSIDEFATIHGVGQAKLKKFATTFLAVIAEYGQ
ncbi:MAG: HRDC domain-containing protein, partial [Alphaproteobacteria bacterium]|nr:HRDC domain-containing protein [Alphaproteobacteria bacterium]